MEEGKLPMSRIDDAVTRILRVKFAMGMMDPKSPPGRRSQAAKHRSARRNIAKIAQQAVRESIVLLKNEARALPVSKKAARIHVAGKNADDIGNQCGGWTISGRARAVSL